MNPSRFTATMKVIVMLLGMMLASTAKATWWDFNWQYRLALDVTESSGVAVTQQQFLLNLDSTSFHADYVWSAEGDDMRFVDAGTGASLSYLIRSWDQAGETASILILVPSLSANETRRLHLYYDNPAAPAVSDPVAVLTEPGLLYHTRNSAVNPATLIEAKNEFYALDDSVAGYGCTNITDFTLINNNALFGPPNNNSNIAFLSNHHFEVTAATAGTWDFRFGGDYGRGGGMYVDGVTLEEAWNEDRWWGFNWANTSETFDGSITLTAGWHTLELIGFEGCCDGGTSVEFRSPAAPTTWLSWSTGNANIRSEKCLPDSNPSTPFPTDLSTSTHVGVDLNGGDIEAGDVIRYTVTLTESNGADAELNDVLADMPLGATSFTIISVPAGATDSSSPAGGANSTGQLAVTNITIPANSAVTIIFEYTVGVLPGGTGLQVDADITNPSGLTSFVLAANNFTTALDAVPLSNIIKHLYLDDNPELSRIAPSSNQDQISLNENNFETWVLDPNLQLDLVVDDAATEIRTSLYLRETGSGSSRNMRITISGSSSGIIAQEEFYNVSLTNSFQLIPFNVDIVGSPPSQIDAGEEIELELYHISGSGNRRLRIRPSTGTIHSVVEFPTDTAINIESIELYDAPYPGGSLNNSFDPGDTVYLRATVSDPFGAYDITAANIDLEDPSGSIEVNDAAMTEVTTGGWPSNSEKLYEYAYPLSGTAPSGNWVARIRSDEGFEGSVEHSANSGFTVAGSLELVVDAGSGSASTCGPYSVNVRMEDGSGSLSSGYLGTISLSTSSGNGTWTTSSNGDLTDLIADDGTASYLFDALDGGEADFFLSNSHADDLEVTITDSANSLSETTATISFRDNRLDIATADTLNDDVVAGRNHTFTATLVRRDNTTGNCGTATGYAGVMPLKAWLSRSLSDPSGTAPGLIGDSTLVSVPDSIPVANNIDLNFVAGVSTFSLSTTDVASYTLNLVDDTSGFASDLSGDPLTLSSSATGAPWTVRPFALRIVAVGNPAATTPAGATYVAAGDDFVVQVTGVQYQVADDNGVTGGTAYDGIADSPSLLIDNLATNSFGQEGETVTLSSSLTLPNPGVDPGLSGAPFILNSFAAGADQATYQFHEVGIIEIAAAITDGAYLGATLPTTQNMYVDSGPVGRFHPDHFRVIATTAGSFDAACSTSTPFTYLGQPFGYAVAPVFRITPRNVGNTNTTQNYVGAFAHLTTGEITVSHPTADATNAQAVSSTINAGSLTANGDGSMSLALNLLDQITYTRGTETEPFTANLPIRITAISETLDSISATGLPVIATPTSSSNRHGRLRVDNAFGPETADLIVPGIVEYYFSGTYQQHTDDGCTLLTGTITPSPSGPLPDIFTDIPIGSGTTTLLANNTVVAGNMGLSLLAPNAGNTGDITLSIDLTSRPYLQFDFDGNGSLDTTLTRVATFGQYRGHDRIIYWREVRN